MHFALSRQRHGPLTAWDPGSDDSVQGSGGSRIPAVWSCAGSQTVFAFPGDGSLLLVFPVSVWEMGFCEVYTYGRHMQDLKSARCSFV